MYTRNLYNEVVQRHNFNGANELEIMGGFVGPSPVKSLTETDLNCRIVYGCLQSGKVSEKLHQQFLRATKSSKKVNLFYKQNYNHSKIYLWKKSGIPIEALVGSANFSTSGLENDFQEVLFKITDRNELDEINSFLNHAIDDSEKISEHYSKFSNIKKVKLESSAVGQDEILSLDPPHVSVSLTIEKGGLIQTPRASGVNWGFKSDGSPAEKRHISDAYIPISSKLVKSVPDLFPNSGVNPNFGQGQGHRNSSAAEAIFDDGVEMKRSFEGYGGKENLVKQLTSLPKKNILGEYIRKRMGLPESAKIEYQDLVEYGRLNIEISLLQEGIYFIDFSN